ncbi:BES1 BZR1 [Musa troglodytarum]|uniref:Protein BZR1 homolog n=1 Tax=Musa troglodytarum TaxID=320322 RepID=A0A9E7FE93_9LILI|nr:BES1 BZR1 [Musa troglodytarum]
MTSGARMPTWRERENNRRRERRRRAVAAKIYAGLRMYGNYRLPKHCDNNEVLKALCDEAGWSVEPDGTTYRKGCKPPAEHMDIVGGSTSHSPYSSNQPSPCASYNPSPASSSYASPASSSYIAATNNSINAADANSLIPWLRNLSSASSIDLTKFLHQHPFSMHGGSISAPVTPPLSSPTARMPDIKCNWDGSNAQPSWTNTSYAFLPNSTPPSPGHQVIPDPAWIAGLQIETESPSSPTFSLVSSNPFSFSGGGSSRMWTPGQSGTSSPALPGMPHDVGVRMCDGISQEFAFGSSTTDDDPVARLVKPWEGERIHEECGSDDLELTLGSSRTRADA